MRKCPKCRREWSPRLPLHLPESEWKKVVKCKLQSRSTNFTAKEVGLHRQRVLRAFEWIRKSMAREEEGRRFKDRVEIGWAEFKVGSNGMNGSHKKKIRVFGIWGEKTLSIEIQQNISLNFVRRVLREKVEVESEVILGPGRWESFSKEKLRADGYSIVHPPDYTPTLHNIFEMLSKVIHNNDLPHSKFQLHIAEFVWGYNRRLIQKDRRGDMGHSILRTLRTLGNPHT